MLSVVNRKSTRLRRVSSRVGTLANATVLAACAIGCAGGAQPNDKPMGALPSAVTSAEPLWIPFTMRAGRAVDADPREGRLRELRQVTFDGKSRPGAWHPSSTRIVVERTADNGLCRLEEIDLATGATRALTPSDRSATGAAFRGPDELVFSLSRAGDACPASGLGGLTGPAAELYPGEIVSVRTGAGAPSAPAAVAQGQLLGIQPSVARDGQVIYTSADGGDVELYSLSRDGTSRTRITREPGFDGGAELSMDGSRLAWHRRVTAPRGTLPPPPAPMALPSPKRPAGAPRPALPLDIPSVGAVVMMASSNGGHARVAVEHGRLSVLPSFLPDSRHLLFSSDFDGLETRGGLPPMTSFDVYLVDLDGPVTASGKPRIERITYKPGYDGEAHVSPDGRLVVFASDRGAAEPGATDVFVARWVDID